MSKKIFYQPTPDESVNAENIVIRKSHDRAEAILDFAEGYFGTTFNERTMLDLGCNTGYFVNFFSSRCALVEGIDDVASNIDAAKSYYPEIADNFKDGDIFLDLYFYPQYDIVLFMNVLHTMMSTKPKAEVNQILKQIDEKTKGLLFFEMRESDELYWISQELDDTSERSRPILDAFPGWNKESIKKYIFNQTSFDACQELTISSDVFDTSKTDWVDVPNIPINRTLFVFFRKGK